jgi:hypothetical protein
MSGQARTVLLGLVVSAAAACGQAEETRRREALEEPAPSSLVDRCVAFRERACRCRHEMVEPMLQLRIRTRKDIAQLAATPGGQARLRRMALQEFVEDGSGPLLPRRNRCEAMVNGMDARKRAVADELEECDRDWSDCARWVSCVMPVLERMMTR